MNSNEIITLGRSLIRKLQINNRTLKYIEIDYYPQYYDNYIQDIYLKRDQLILIKCSFPETKIESIFLIQFYPISFKSREVEIIYCPDSSIPIDSSIVKKLKENKDNKLINEIRKFIFKKTGFLDEYNISKV